MNELDGKQVVAYLAERSGEVTNPWPSEVCGDCVGESSIHAVYFFTKYMMELLGGKNCAWCGRALGMLAMDYQRNNVKVTSAATRSQLHLDLPGTGSSESRGTVPERTDG